MRFSTMSNSRCGLSRRARRVTDELYGRAMEEGEMRVGEGGKGRAVLGRQGSKHWEGSTRQQMESWERRTVYPACRQLSVG